MKRNLAVVVGVLVGLVVVVSAGTWLYINVLRDDPPERLTLDDASMPGSGGTSAAPSTTASSDAVAGDAGAGVDGTWRVTTGTEAGYRVPEVLNGQETEGVGRTNQVEGEVVIAGTRATAATFTVDIASVTSDEARRDNQFRGRIMDVASHPTATFVLGEPIEFAAVPVEGVRLEASATGRLTLRGVTRDVTFDVQGERNGDTIRIVGSIPITFADHDIPDPSAGPAQVGDEGELEFLLVLVR